MPHEGIEPSSIDGVSIILLRTMRQGGKKNGMQGNILFTMEVTSIRLKYST